MDDTDEIWRLCPPSRSFSAHVQSLQTPPPPPPPPPRPPRPPRPFLFSAAAAAAAAAASSARPGRPRWAPPPPPKRARTGEDGGGDASSDLLWPGDEGAQGRMRMLEPRPRPPQPDLFLPPSPPPRSSRPAAKRGLLFSSTVDEQQGGGGGEGRPRSPDRLLNDCSLDLTQYIHFQVDRHLDAREEDKEADEMIEEVEEEEEDDLHHPSRGFFTPKSAPATRPVPPLTIPKLTPGGSSSGTMRLRPTSDVPERFRGVFADFSHFNIVQSTVFDDLVLGSAAAVVVSAPTGSGKTVLFELAIVRALEESGVGVGRPTASSKLVYLSPMKSLCSERMRDWSSKFGPLGVRCLELTGDSPWEDVAAIRNYDLVLTTPEKWDVVTRRWKEHGDVARTVGLLMIDEVHLLNDQSRGHTLEAIVSRAKTIAKTAGSPRHGAAELRFVAVSATIPNAEDIALWLGGEQGVSHKFGEERRPVQLRKVVLGYPHREGTSEFKFEMNLSYKLSSLVATYSEGKPTLIFCSSRKATQFTAATVARDSRLQLAWAQRQSLQEVARNSKDQKLADCLVVGVGFHHAGLEQGDRRAVEELFLSGNLPILVSTSTLAMGVNLPAHLVIIKGTGQIISSTYREYSESQVLQMIGRAGRPQFDTTATAVIMTTDKQKAHYSSLVNGTQLVESSLHENMEEHLNAEVVLGTITDIAVALAWLRSTFYFVRAAKNPGHYGLPKGMTPEQLDRRLQDLCMANLNALAGVGIIEMTAEIEVRSTKAGNLMASYFVAFDTMKNFSSVSGDEELPTLVSLLCKSKEFEDIPLRRGERTSLNSLNKDKHKATIRFPLEGKVKDKNMKISVLMQSALGCLHIADPALAREATRVIQVSKRLAKCLVEYIWALDEKDNRYYKALRGAVVLSKSLTCGIWNNSAYVSKQFDRVGVAYSTSLVHAGFSSFQRIRQADPRNLEMVLNKQPPFGNHVRNCAAAMPEYNLRVESDDGDQRRGGRAARLKISVTMENADAVRDRSTAGRYHACVLLVGGPRNRTELKARVRDSAILSAGGYRRVVSVTRPPGMSGVPIRVAWISESFAGVDVLKNVRVGPDGMSPSSIRLEALSDKSMAEFCHGKEEEQDNEGAREVGGTVEQRPPTQRIDLRLSPACIKELQKEWSPVSQYFCKETRVITTTSVTTTEEVRGKIGAEPQPPQLLTVANRVQHGHYQIDYLERRLKAAPAKVLSSGLALPAPAPGETGGQLLPVPKNQSQQMIEAERNETVDGAAVSTKVNKEQLLGTAGENQMRPTTMTGTGGATSRRAPQPTPPSVQEDERENSLPSPIPPCQGSEEDFGRSVLHSGGEALGTQLLGSGGAAVSPTPSRRFIQERGAPVFPAETYPAPARQPGIRVPEETRDLFFDEGESEPLDLSRNRGGGGGGGDDDHGGYFDDVRVPRGEKMFDFSGERFSFPGEVSKVEVDRHLSRQEEEKSRTTRDEGEERKLLSEALRKFLASNNLGHACGNREDGEGEEEDQRRRRQQQQQQRTSLFRPVASPEPFYPFRRTSGAAGPSQSLSPSPSQSTLQKSVAEHFAVRRRGGGGGNPFRNSKLREFWPSE